MIKLEHVWQQVAIAILEDVYKTVNTPSMVGTNEETGVLIMFFNAKKHEGKSTMVVTGTAEDGVRKLLEAALSEAKNFKKFFKDSLH